MRRTVSWWMTVIALVLTVAGVASHPAQAVVPAPAAGLAQPTSATSATPAMVALSPARLLDTRSGVGGAKGPAPAGSTTALTVAGRGGVPAAGIAAVVVNLTVTQPAAAGYLTAWPAGVGRPTTSNVNYVTGQTVADQAIVKVGSGGAVHLYSLASSHLIVDVTGYYPTGAAFTTLRPARVLDTRSGARPAPASTTNVVVTGRGGVPSSGAAAVVLTVTAVGSTGPGYVTAYPAGTSRPIASTLNYASGRTVAGMVMAKVGTGGAVSLYTLAGANLVVDVSGWIPAASDYVPLAPTRVMDTRDGTGVPKARVPAGGSITLAVAGVGAVPATGPTAVEVTLTVARPASSGYVATYPSGVSRPTTSTLSYVAGESRANSATVRLGANGALTVYSQASTDLIVDLVGYFRPAPSVSKLLVIVEENETTAAYAQMPYLKSLSSHYGTATGYTGLVHPSLGNYLAMVSGQGSGTCGLSDPLPASCPQSEATVFGHALSAGRTATIYAESMTTPCQGTNSNPYAARHNPWAYFAAERSLCAAHDVPAGTTTSGALRSDIDAGTLPNAGLIVPNLVNDAHDGTLGQADHWLHQWVPQIMAGPDYRAGRLAVVITFDEGAGTNQNIPFVIVHPSLTAKVITTRYTHYGLARLYTDILGLAPLQAGATEPGLRAAFGL